MRHSIRLTAFLALLFAPALIAARRDAPQGKPQEPSAGKLLGGWALDGDGSIRIHNHEGSIRVIGWTRDSVAVRGVLGARGSFFGGGSRRGIKFGVEVAAGSTASPTTLTAYVPVGASVFVRGASTDITIEGLTGSVDVSCVTGAVIIRGDPRDLVAEAMEGSLLIVGSPGILRAKTAGASLRWTGTAADATLGSVSGRVEALLGPLGRARIETISGEVLLDAALRADAEVVIESHAGSIAMRAPESVPTLLRVDAASVGGDGIPTTSGFTKAGKREPVRTIPLAGAHEHAPAASVTVRSFKGAFRLLAPAPPR